MLHLMTHQESGFPGDAHVGAFVGRQIQRAEKEKEGNQSDLHRTADCGSVRLSQDV